MAPGNESGVMFEELLSALRPGTQGEVLDAWEALAHEPAYGELLRACPDGTLGAGSYRLHDAVSGPWAAEWLAAVGVGTGREVPFAYDWLGRQLALDGDARRRVVLCDPFGDRVRLEVGFVEFHRDLLPHTLDDVLDQTAFRTWAAAAALASPLRREQAAVYARSPLLGGTTNPENLRLGTLDEQRALSLFTFADGRRPGERCEQIVSELLLAGRLSDALHHEDPFVRAHALTFWSPAVPAADLVEALRDDVAAVRDAAAMRLMDVAPTAETIAALTEALADADEDVRWSAELALQQLRGDMLQRVADDVRTRSESPGQT